MLEGKEEEDRKLPSFFAVVVEVVVSVVVVRVYFFGAPLVHRNFPLLLLYDRINEFNNILQNMKYVEK